jgi:4-hydroxy-2-oxoglutarate aldolase
VQLFDHAVAGRRDEALALQRALTPIARLVSSVYGVAGLKAALDLAGFHGGPVRGPLLPVSDREREDIARTLSAASR